MEIKWNQTFLVVCELSHNHLSGRLRDEFSMGSERDVERKLDTSSADLLHCLGIKCDEIWCSPVSINGNKYQYTIIFGKSIKKKKKKSRFDDINGPTELRKQFRWHQVIHTLIKELNTTEKAVYKKNYISCLNWLSYLTEKNQIETAKAKQS